MSERLVTADDGVTYRLVPWREKTIFHVFDDEVYMGSLPYGAMTFRDGLMRIDMDALIGPGTVREMRKGADA